MASGDYVEVRLPLFTGATRAAGTLAARMLGGPQAVTAFLRGITWDVVSHVDRQLARTGAPNLPRLAMLALGRARCLCVF